jgi:hypothetical protein
VTCRKWSKFENDQLPGQIWVKSGQSWSNLVKHGQKKMVKKDGRRTWPKNMVSVYSEKIYQGAHDKLVLCCCCCHHVKMMGALIFVIRQCGNNGMPIFINDDKGNFILLLLLLLLLLAST